MGALQNLQGATANLNAIVPAIVAAIAASKTGIADADVQAQVDILNVAVGQVNNALAAPAVPVVPVVPAA